MADNITLNAGSGGSTVKTDDDGTAHWQYVKLAYGADNTQTRVTATNPLPVDIYSGTIDVMLGTDFSAVLGSSNLVATDGSAALTLGLHALGTDGTNAQIISTNATGHVNIADGGNTITVDGTVTANLGATDNAVLDSIQTAVELIDDAVYVDDADWTDSTSKHVLTGGVYQSSPQTITDGDVGPFQVTANGYLITSVNGTVTVDGSGVTQPVSGTVTANLGATDNAVLDSIDTAVNLIDDAVYTDATGTPSKGLGVMGTDGTNPQIVSVDSSGHLQVDILSGTGADSEGAALGSGMLIQGDDGTDRKNVNVDATTGNLQVDVTTNSSFITSDGNASPSYGVAIIGDDGANAQNVAVDSSGHLQVDVLSTPLDGVEVTLGTDTYTETADTGVAIAAVRNDTLATLADTDNEFAPLQVDGLGALYTRLAPATSGGLSYFKTIDLDETEEEVKASAGQVYGIFFTNSNAAVRYLKLYDNTAATVVVGTTVPDITIPLPPSDSGVFLKFEQGLEFSNAITIAATTGVGDADSGAPGANEVVGFVAYK